MALVTDAEVLKMINGLVVATKAGRIKWEASDQFPGEFTAATAKFSFFIRSRDEDDAAPHVFVVFKRDAVSSGALIEITTRAEKMDVLKAANELFNSAKLSTFGVGSLIDEVLDDIS